MDLDEAKVLGTKKRQLIAQCKDLIFITPDPGAGVLFSERVGFLHRTVVDYLHTTDVKSKLLRIPGADCSANKVLLETNLGQLRSLIHLHSRTYIRPHLQQWILGSLYYAHVLEVMTAHPETNALDELEVIIMKAFAKWGFSEAMNCFFRTAWYRIFPRVGLPVRSGILCMPEVPAVNRWSARYSCTRLEKSVRDPAAIEL